MNGSEFNEIKTSFNVYRNAVNRVYWLKISVSRSSHVLDSLKGPKRSPLGQRFKNAACHWHSFVHLYLEKIHILGYLRLFDPTGSDNVKNCVADLHSVPEPWKRSSPGGLSVYQTMSNIKYCRTKALHGEGIQAERESIQAQGHRIQGCPCV